MWFRYGDGSKEDDLELELTDQEAKLIMNYLSDPFELKRVDGTDISYLFE